ncbi:MAG: transporter substrate-binding domain-containing protein [Candidatus Nanopelagicales bacterium]|nr:transporter substrate-binding domain-containing protein [Candidatus Nanopelagicales bacterium]
MNRRVAASLIALIGSALVLEACSAQEQVAIPAITASSDAIEGALFATGDCAPANLTTRDAGHLNVGYAQPKPLYFIDRSPADPVGFEVAVVNAIARALGFDSNQVQWKKVSSAQLVTPTRQDLDFGIGQVASSEVSAGILQSLPYLKEQHVLLARPNTSLANVTSAAALQGSNLGVVKGSSSDTYVADVLKLESLAYPSNNILKSAMRDHHINGMVVPLDQVMPVLSTFNGELVVVGLFDPARSAPKYVLTMIPGDPLITCVNLVLENMMQTGQLANLQANWFTTGVNRTLSTKV